MRKAFEAHKINSKRRRGFTLVEIIVVVAILTILLAIGVPAVAGYIVSSEMIELNQNAKTIYLVAQDYLTQAAAGGSLEAINKAAYKVENPGSIVPAPGEDEMRDNKNNLAYLRICKNGEDENDNGKALLAMLTPYVNDPNILQQSVLVEYNRNTGVVRSVLYSKKANALDYTGNLTDSGNVLDRNDAALRQKRQGYYGVDYTGNLENAAVIAGTKPVLVNSDRLTLEWDNTTPTTGNWKKFLTFTVTIYSEDYGTEYLRLENVPNPAMLSGGYPSSKAKSETKLVTLDTYWNGVLQTDEASRKHAISVLPGDTPGGPQKMVLILDDIHRAIYEAYPSIPIGNLHATVEPCADWIKVPAGQTQQSAHSYFASEKKDAGKSTYTYQIEYARQLNNIRHAAPDSNYNLKKTDTGTARTINWAQPETLSDANPAVVNFEVINFQYRTYNADAAATEVEDINGYRGTLTADGAATISNMTLVPTSQEHLKQHKNTYDFKQYYGMFAQLAKGATVQNLKLNTIKLNTAGFDATKSFSYVGALAGKAVEATIDNVRVENTASVIVANSAATVTQDDKNAYTGGVLGYAEKCTMKSLSSAANVQSGSHADRQVKNGRDCIGGVIGCMKGGTLTGSTISQNTGSVFGGENVGGVVGMNDGGTITQPMSTGKYVVGLSNVGGVVGYNKSGTVTNAKAIYNVDADSVLVSVFNELKTPAAFETNVLKFETAKFVGVLGQENVGGVIGLNDKDATLSGFTTKQTVKGAGNVGGIVGKNIGKMTWTDANKTSEGIVICAGSYAGGVLGVNTNDGVRLDNLVNASHVVAKEYAGGIIGSNGDADGDTGQVTATTISNCKNTGSVFAYYQYGGGIAGRNLGRIEVCESTAQNAETLDKRLAAAGISYGDYVGGITGYNNGEIVKCKNANLVKGKDFVGGITGHNDTTGYIFGCQTAGGRVIGTGNFVGGFIGLNTSSQLAKDKDMGGLHNLATLVQGKRFVGGVIGCNLFTSGDLKIQASNGSETLDREDANQTVVEGEYYVGGIIGYNCMTLKLDQLPDPEQSDRPGEYNGSGATPGNKTTLTLCYNYGQVKTLRYGGGIIGLNSPESALVIEDSSNRGVVAYANYSDGTFDRGKSYYIAGITGRNTRTGVIDNCTNSGKVLSRSKYTGGLVEVNEGLMIDCTNGGQVLAEQSSYVGGIAGYNITAGTVAGGTDGKATIRACMTTDKGRVGGVNYVGGIVGANASVLERCTLNGSTDYATETFHVYGTGDCVGGIVGFNQTKGILDGCATQGGSVRGRNFVGGLVGYTNSSVGLSGSKSGLTTTYTQNGSRVYGQYYVGGIAGALAQSISALEYCENTGFGRVVGYGTQTSGDVTLTLEERDSGNKDVTTTLTFDRKDMGVGGIVGVVRKNDTLKHCVNNGVVVGAGAQTGGITGLNLGTLETCVNRGMVIGSSQASNLAIRDDLNKIRNDKDQVGGIAGCNTGKVISCTAEGAKTRAAGGNTTNLVAGCYNVGGIVGLLESGTVEEPSVRSTAVQVKGFARTGGLLGRWVQTDATLILTDKNVTATVTGTSTGQTIVPNKQHEIAVGGVFGQIDSAPGATAANPAVIADGYTFSGVAKLDTAADWQYVGGILPKISETQSVKNCDLAGTVSSAVSATANTGAGGIVGENAGRVESCTMRSSASVTGDSKLGGIIGENALQGTMLHCLNENGATVNGAGSMIGGYIGRNQNPQALVRGAVTDNANGGRLINFAKVVGGKSVGGIVGEQAGSMTACDNKATVQVYKYYGGGVLGKFVSSGTQAFAVQDCVNYGDILLLNIGTENDGGTGGVVGLIETAPNAAFGLTVENCRNEGTLTVPDVRPGTKTYVYARYVGGVAGQVRSGGTVKNSANASSGEILFYPGSGLYQGNGTSSTVGGAGVGGVVGLATNEGRVESCENLGTLALTMKQPKDAAGNDKESISSEGVAVGGVVGSLKNNGFVIGCTNQGTLKIEADSKYHGIGGVVGSAYSAAENGLSGTVQGCTNESPVKGEMAYAVGGILGLSNGALVEDCTNNASISALGQVGGIVGAIYRDKYNVLQDNTIRGSVNHGVISNNPGKLAGYNVNAIGGILGDVGANEACITIEACTNNGEVQLISSENTSFNGAGGILGRTSFGPTEERKIKVLNSKNTATISPLTEGRKAGIGGIIGDAIHCVLVQNCTNAGEITDDGKGTYENVGGIVGNMSRKESLVENCRNSAPITASNGNTFGTAVGGVVGLNYGTVASSVNAAAAGDASNPKITGRDSVGGIVGMNRGQTAFIYSPLKEASTPVTTVNEMAVQATAGDAGGIAGKSLSGGVVDTLNKGDVTASAAAGGLIGRAAALKETNTAEPQAAGELANSYNLAKVFGAQFEGGVIGARDAPYDSVRGHKIKQAFYLWEDNHDYAMLSVGNEPDTTDTVSENDEPQRAELGANRRLSDDLFRYYGITVPNFNDIIELKNAVDALQASVRYSLEQPRKVTVDTQSAQGYEYTTSWEMVQGLVDHYEVYLRKKGADGAAIHSSTDIKLGDSKRDPENAARLETFLTFNMEAIYRDNKAQFDAIYGSSSPSISSFEDIIGCEFDIVVKTIAIKDAGPQDSKALTSEQNRKILPVLPTPTTTKQIFADKIYELTLQRSLYEAVPDSARYKNLSAGPAGLYQQPQWNGVSQFVFQNVGAKTDTWQDTAIVPTDAANPYSFKIDHSTDFANTTNPLRTINLQALSNDTENGYANSEIFRLDYKVQVRLNPPPNIQARFSGTNAQAAYLITWNAVQNNRGYCVEISYKDMNNVVQTQQIDAPKDATRCTWQVPTDIISGSNVSFTIKTLGENGLSPATEDQIYLTSRPSDPPTDIALPLRLNPVQVNCTQGTERDMDIAVNWTAANDAALISNYVLSIQRHPIGNSTKLETYLTEQKIESSENNYALQFAEADFNYVYFITMRAEGVKEKSLTSTDTIKEFTLYPRRTMTSGVTYSRTGKASFAFKWDGKTLAGTDYPEQELLGPFQLRFSDKTGNLLDAVTVDTADALKVGVEYIFDAAKGFVVGTEYQVELTALAVEGKYSRSYSPRESNAVDFRLPKNVPPVQNLQAKAQADVDITQPRAVTQYDGVQYTVSWDSYDTQIGIKSFSVQAYVTQSGTETEITGELTWTPEQSLVTPTATSVMFGKLPAAYAGKEITIKVIAVAGDVTTDSDPAVVKITAPKARLEAPTVTEMKQGTAGAPDAKDVTIVLDAAQTGVLQSLVDWEKNIQSYTANLSLVCDVPNGNVDGSPATVEKTLVFPIEITDFVDKTTNSETPAARTNFRFAQADLLNAIHAQYPELASTLTEMPILKAGSTASIFLTAANTEATGFTNSDGTNSTEGLSESALNAMQQPAADADANAAQTPQSPPSAGAAQAQPQSNVGAASDAAGASVASMADSNAPASGTADAAPNTNGGTAIGDNAQAGNSNATAGAGSSDTTKGSTATAGAAAP